MTKEAPQIQGDTPTLRLFALLEVIAQKDEFISLQGLVEETGLPKPTLHRMLQQLESAGIIQKDGEEIFKKIQDFNLIGVKAELKKLQAQINR